MLLQILFLLFLVALSAGFIDTLAGGGGMLTIPALLISGLPPESALATNKLQASFGTVSASWYFIRRGQLNWRALLPAMMLCALGAISGTLLVHYLSSAWLEKIIPLLLMSVALLFIRLPKLGEVEHKARLSLLFFSACIALPIGFYDGFLGPGTGSFFLLALITLRGLTLQQATIEAKAFNAITNLTSLAIFSLTGNIVWQVGLTMAIGQLIGARLASGLIMRQGNRLIRPIVVSMSIVMSAILAYKYWF